MTGRHSLLADIEAKRCKDGEDPVEVLKADVMPVAEDLGHNPYDNPGPAKPLDLDHRATKRRRALQTKK